MPDHGQNDSRTAPPSHPLPPEDLLVLILEGQIEGLRGEEADDVGHVTPPEGQHALLGDVHDVVPDALIQLVAAICLHLQQQLNQRIRVTVVLEIVAVMPLARKYFREKKTETR